MRWYLIILRFTSLAHHSRQKCATWLHIFKIDFISCNYLLDFLTWIFVIFGILKVPVVKVDFCGACQTTFIPKVWKSLQSFVIKLVPILSLESKFSRIVFTYCGQQGYKTAYSFYRLLSLHFFLITVYVKLLHRLISFCKHN